MNFDRIFCPESITLIGASREEKSVGYGLLANLLHGEYEGPIFPVNPHAQEILGTACYTHISDIHHKLDQVIIAVPAAIVQVVAEEAVAAGANSLIVISAGFGEQGADGKKREEQLVELCKKHNVMLVGPNCLGILNPHIGLNASFETVLPKKGNIAFLSQSGALISSLIDIATDRGIGFSKIISLGNKALLGEHDLLPYLFADPQTQVIILYAEFLNDAPGLISILRKNASSPNPKPVVMLKSGVSEAGIKASSSHTGALAGSDAAYQAICRQAGIVRVHSVDELLSAAQVFSQNLLPQGNHVAIVTNAGGPGIIATDESSRAGLFLSMFTPETKEQLQKTLPPASHVANPVDVLGDATSARYEAVLTVVANDPHVDSIVTIVTPQTMTDIPETAAAIIRLKQSTKKPIVATFMGAPNVETGTALLSATNTSHIQFPEQAVMALAHASEFAAFVAKHPTQEHSEPPQNESPIKAVVRSLAKQGVQLMETTTVFDILSTYGVPVVRHALVQSAEQAIQVAPTIGELLACKIVSPQISHKTEAGGVLLNIPEKEAGEAFKTILNNVKRNVPEAQTHGVLLTPMVTGEGLEMIIGLKHEENLGTLIMVGLGGIYVELFRDTSFRFAPLSADDAKEMISELKAFKILQGLRGKLPLDTDVLVKVIQAMSQIAEDMPEIAELDINPLFIQQQGQGALVLDARISLKAAFVGHSFVTG